MGLVSEAEQNPGRDSRLFKTGVQLWVESCALRRGRDGSELLPPGEALTGFVLPHPIVIKTSEPTLDEMSEGISTAHR